MHTQADMQQWRGRVDALEGEAGKRWHQVVSPELAAPSGKGIALVGFACDAGVARNHGRIGASKGPAATRAALGNMPVHACRSIVDAGDIAPRQQGDHDGLEEAQQELAARIDDILSCGRLPVALGGGHEIAFGSFSGLARHLAARPGVPRIGVINLDAHFDLRMAEQASSGTPFRQIAEDCASRGWAFNYCCLGISRFGNTEALFECARKLGVRWRLDEEMSLLHLGETLHSVQDFLAGVDHVYFTTCLDVLPAATAPGVSAPAARGVSLEVIESIVDAVAGSGKLRVADIAELNPAHDIDQRTARVAARLVARIADAYCAARTEDAQA
ncbi:formimidoylglutamase [Noviherbaspirillum galbum]|nr:formimidoylglutamase [Noviherbaspirillum galbum]